MNNSQTTLEDFKTALRLDNETITGWVAGKRSPDGEKVSRTNVYHALNYGTPQWMLEEINQKIARSRNTYTEFYARRAAKKYS